MVEAADGDGLVREGDDDLGAVAPSADSDYRRRKKLMRLAVLGVLGSLILYAVLDRERVKGFMKSFLGWVETHPTWGVFAFILLYALATVLFVPGAVLTFGCGFTFGSVFGMGKGVALASVSVFIGATIGSIAAFLLGRYLLRDLVEDLIKEYPIFNAVDRALQGNGLQIMILLRLSPLIPYNGLDYMSGATSIPLWSYTAALVAILPGVVMYTFLGSSASSLANSGESPEHPTVRLFSLVFGIVFAILGVAVASYYANRELKKILAVERDNCVGETNTSNGGSDNARSSLLV